jgi:glyoxylase-like metal-dependent hydrolase (beta-lactamase superfamily II)
MAEVRVLVEGVHKPLENGLVKIGCTTTLIKSDQNIVVDPGSFVNRNMLIAALKNEGLKPEGIEIVILTHLHIDHSLNTGLFPNAKVFMRFRGETVYPGQFQKISEGYLRRFDVLNEPIAENVKIIETPGHTSDSITVLVETAEGVVAITGDAIGGEDQMDLAKKPDPNIFYDIEKFDISRNKIIEIADYIIPGHGGMFKVNK